MGQKVNPNGLRVGIIKDWNTQWYANKKDFAALIYEDYKIREHIKRSTTTLVFLNYYRKTARQNYNHYIYF